MLTPPPLSVAAHPFCVSHLGEDEALQRRLRRADEADRDGRLLLVTAALLQDGEGRVLVALRPPGRDGISRWEFPGGKLEEGETLEGCLAREMREEMEVEIAPPTRFLLSDHDQGDRFIRLFALRSRIVSGEVRLHFHREARWLPPAEAAALPDLAPADLPIARAWGLALNCKA